jgi:hypothetical protein
MNNWEKTIKLELTLDVNYPPSKLFGIFSRWNIYQDSDGYYKSKSLQPKDSIQAGAYEILKNKNIKQHVKKCEITYEYEGKVYIEDFLEQMNELGY